LARFGKQAQLRVTGHPKAKRCYAWCYQDKGETQYVNVLEIPPVKSAKTAVQVQIMSDFKKRKKTQ